ncbi:hypothetical protein [Chryseobacterium sp. YR459]|uniref:hypothetical protein n=1 Tax=Chryseobacterium sp. HR92 TaxID=3094839 RepID=UPI000648980B|nr:hypothetical protein SFA27_13100 [Chryseobacterium sp. HR92]
MYPFDFDYLCRSSRLGNKQACMEIMIPNSGLQKTININQLPFDLLFTITWNDGGCCCACSWSSVNKFQLNNKYYNDYK